MFTLQGLPLLVEVPLPKPGVRDTVRLAGVIKAASSRWKSFAAQRGLRHGNQPSPEHFSWNGNKDPGRKGQKRSLGSELERFLICFP